ncbi:MAG: hypothetical protein GY792_31425 [Gammaproteobacteria bacterium]|nr:hypothetical protein [Gammaproteobacteria bacterium]
MLLKLLEIDEYALQKAILEQYRKQKHNDWQALYDFATAHPEMICQVSPRHIDIPLWRILWQSDIDECRQWVINTLCYTLSRFKLNDDDGPLLADYFAELAETHADLLLAHLNERYLEGWARFYQAGVALLWPLHLPDFDSILLGSVDILPGIR